MTSATLPEALRLLGLQAGEVDPTLRDRMQGVATADEVRVLSALGGQSVAEGSYWVLTAQQAGLADAWAWGAFSELKQRKVRCFGRDWMGRLFAVDPSRGVVFMVDANRGMFSVSPASLAQFYIEDLVEYRDEVLEVELYRQWLAAGGEQVNSQICIGYKVPAFMGGDQSLMSLEPIDIDVYWTLTGQAIAHHLGTPYDSLGRE